MRSGCVCVQEPRSEAAELQIVALPMGRGDFSAGHRRGRGHAGRDRAAVSPAECGNKKSCGIFEGVFRRPPRTDSDHLLPGKLFMVPAKVVSALPTVSPLQRAHFLAGQPGAGSSRVGDGRWRQRFGSDLSWHGLQRKSGFATNPGSVARGATVAGIARHQGRIRLPIDPGAGKARSFRIAVYLW